MVSVLIMMVRKWWLLRSSSISYGKLINDHHGFPSPTLRKVCQFVMEATIFRWFLNVILDQKICQSWAINHKIAPGRFSRDPRPRRDPKECGHLPSMAEVWMFWRPRSLESCAIYKEVVHIISNPVQVVETFTERYCTPQKLSTSPQKMLWISNTFLSGRFFFLFFFSQARSTSSWRTWSMVAKSWRPPQGVCWTSWRRRTCRWNV